jgi:glyoxylase-like metal-dependent hydrolase (beta-lactamase superfamily II)
MPTVRNVGAFTITALNDGTVRLPPSHYTGLDWSAHAHLIAGDGTYHIPIGAFLVQGAGVAMLVDAGLGPMAIPYPPQIARAAGLGSPPEHIAVGGGLPRALAAAGVSPGDISIVFLTHLDADHVGWIAPDGELFFPRADVVCSAVELARPPGPAPGEAEGRRGFAVARGAGRLRTVRGHHVELAPGVVAHHAPGHKPGHYVVSVRSDGEEARLLGDAFHHPVQLSEPTVQCVFDDDPAAALRTREALAAELEGRDIAVNMAHFPGLEFHRIAVEGGRRRWVEA